MKRCVFLFVAVIIIPVGRSNSAAQSPSQRNPNVSNKALITKSTPGINPDAFKNQSASTATATLHKLADEYYAWRNENYPVRSSEAGLHTWDDRLTDYSPGKIAERAQHVRSLLDKVRALKTDRWPKDERIDWILFRAQLENVDFDNRVLRFESTNPQVYTEECTSAIFSLLKKEYDTPRNRALAATARLKQMPALLKQGLSNLQKPVKLYSQLAIQSARSIDPLLNNSLMSHESHKGDNGALSQQSSVTTLFWNFRRWIMKAAFINLELPPHYPMGWITVIWSINVGACLSLHYRFD